MQSKTLFGCVLGTLVAFTGAAQTTNQILRSLSLKECLEMALAHNLDLQIERYSPQIANYHSRAAYGTYDPVLDLNATLSYVDQPPDVNYKKYPLRDINSGVSINSEYELTTDTIGSGVSGRLPVTGLGYNFYARADHRDRLRIYPSIDDLLSGPMPYFYTNNNYATVGLTLRQPLLKDFWIDPYRRIIQLSKKNLKISELAFKGLLMSNATTVTTAYYNLIYAREQINVEKKALELAAQLLEETHKKVQAGTLLPLDEKQAEADIELIRTALFAAEQKYAEQENYLKNLLSDNLQGWMDTRIEPSESLTVADLPANRSVSWVNALTRRPDMQQMRLDLEKQDINLRFTYNQLFPSLDVIGSYGFQAVEHKWGSTWDTIGNGGNAFYTVGVALTFPLGNTTARNNYKASQLAKKQALLQFKKLEQDVVTDVDTAVKLVETTYKQIFSTRKAREYAQAALEAEQTKYLNGTTTSFVVQEFQRNLTRSRSAEIRALTDYNIALAKLSLSEGTTLEKNQITFKLK